MKPTARSARTLPISPIALAVLALAASVSAHAQAQSQSQTTVPATSESTVGSNSAGSSATAVNPNAPMAEVFVTATKRTTSLQRTPVAITALNAAGAGRRPRADHRRRRQPGAGLPGHRPGRPRRHHHDPARHRQRQRQDRIRRSGSGHVHRRHLLAASRRRQRRCCSTWTPSKCCAARKARCGAATPPSAPSTCRPPSPSSARTAGSVEAGIGDYNRLGARGAFNIPLSDTAAAARRLRPRAARRLRRLPEARRFPRWPTSAPAFIAGGGNPQPTFQAAQPEPVRAQRPEIQRPGPDRPAPVAAVEADGGHDAGTSPTRNSPTAARRR